MKMKTLRTVLCLSLALVVFSCKKGSNSSGSNGDSYVKIKKNGNWVTYAGLGELGADFGNSSKTDLGISGLSNDMKENFNISIQIDGPNFQPGTYRSDAYPPYVIVSFTVSSASDIKMYRVEDAAGMAPSKYTVNITSITTTEIKGTFTGNYLHDTFSADAPDHGVVQITEGEFKVKRIR